MGSFMGYVPHHSGWLQTEEGKLCMPFPSQWKIIKTLYQAFHLGKDKIYPVVQSLFTGKDSLKTF
jgi:hypothetical protein